MLTGARVLAVLALALATKVKAPRIAECYANFECKLIDARFVQKYNFLVLRNVKAQAGTASKCL